MQPCVKCRFQVGYRRIKILSPELPLLRDLVILLASSTLIAYASSRLKLPMIVGFILTGAIIGPYSLGLIHDLHAVESLAEIGVVLLLFTIGLEFSLQSLLKMKSLVFGAGLVQIMATTAVVTLIGLLCGAGFNTALFWGFLLTLSSTAIVLKSYAMSAETDTQYGRVSLGVLLFQDLCVVPIMLVVPMLSGQESGSLSSLLAKLFTAVVAVVLIIITAQWLVPKAFEKIVRLRSREVFVGFTIVVCMGTAWLTANFGLSLALGSFLAGLVLSESEYSHQIVADILPFRDVFNSIFFISVGMLLSPRELWSHIDLVLPLLVLLIAAKTVLTAVAAMSVGASLRVALISGLGLAQIGEFSFIVAKVGVKEGLLDTGNYQMFLGLSILSMVATPFLIKLAPALGYWVEAKLKLKPKRLESSRPERLSGHVVIAGYGLNGKNLSVVLKRAGIPYLVLDFNPDQVAHARKHGEPIHYGDCTQREVLHALSIEKARIFVVAISDAAASRRAVAIARELNPHLEIIVRTRFMMEFQDLHRIGANQVIPEEFETSIEIFSRVLKHYGVSHRDILKEVSRIRSCGYQTLRRGGDDDESEVAEIIALSSTETVRIPVGSRADRQTIGSLNIRKQTGASVVAVVREGKTLVGPGAEYEIMAEDILVLLGSPESIEKALELLTGIKETL